MNLEMRRGNRTYLVNIDERIVCVSGNSGMGKTVFVDDLKYVLDNSNTTKLNSVSEINSTIGDYIYCDAPIMIPRDINDVENFYKVDSNTWMIVDEDFSGIGKPYTNIIIQSSDVKILFVTRDYKLCKLASGVGGLYEIVEDSNCMIKLTNKELKNVR